MYCSELDSFVQKFKHLWHSGVNAHLDVHTHAGQAWVSLHVQLGQAPGPVHPVFPPKRKKHSPSRERRRARRAEARQKQAEEALDKAKENEAVKAGPALSENDEVGNHEEEQDVSIVNDELCPDDVYHQAESESIGNRAFRCNECRMLFLPSSHVDGSKIEDFNSCRRHIGVQKCSSCKIVFVGLAKIGCH